nr:helix-turn-helix transcriptional regulator [Marinicella sp. W31]MDC2875567.1 helix-turn-helix transcriptional regulator [Marinicella sp. W31]
METHGNKALGDFLRARRARLSAETLGLKTNRRRRTEGLRREEVAERADIGIDWYIRLEQGRAISPSIATVDALARALCLDETDHAHLRALARLKSRQQFAPEEVSADVSVVVRSLREPAYIMGQRWDVLCWNEATASLFVDFARIPETERNILHFMFLDGKAKALFGCGWTAQARRMVAQFRANHDLWSGDPAFQNLVGVLTDGSPEFSGWWRAHDVGFPEAGAKTLYDGAKQRAFHHASFLVSDNPALRLVIYTSLSDDADHRMEKS